MKLTIKVTPYASKDEVVKMGNEYNIRVKAAAQEGKANEAVIALLASHFKVPKSAVRIISGHTGRNKIVEVRMG